MAQLSEVAELTHKPATAAETRKTEVAQRSSQLLHGACNAEAWMQTVRRKNWR